MIHLSFSSFRKAKARRRVVPSSPSPQPAPGASPMWQENSGFLMQQRQPSLHGHLRGVTCNSPQVKAFRCSDQGLLSVCAQQQTPPELRAQRRTSGCQSAAPGTTAPFPSTFTRKGCRLPPERLSPLLASFPHRKGLLPGARCFKFAENQDQEPQTSVLAADYRNGLRFKTVLCKV